MDMDICGGFICKRACICIMGNNDRWCGGGGGKGVWVHDIWIN